jgi:hypothetical protein
LLRVGHAFMVPYGMVVGRAARTGELCAVEPSVVRTTVVRGGGERLRGHAVRRLSLVEASRHVEIWPYIRAVAGSNPAAPTS